MKPIKFPEQMVTFAGHHPHYLPLPVYKYYDAADTFVIFCWRMTWRERVKILFTGVLWQQVLTFDRALQPLKLMSDKPDMPFQWERE